MPIKEKSLSLPRNLALETFGGLLIVFWTKVNLLYLLYSWAQRYCLLHLIKQNCLLKTFLGSVIPKLVKKVIINFDLSKASSPPCIPVVVLKNCEPELSFILAQFFSMCLKKSSDCWKVLMVVPVFMNVGERCTAKTSCPISLLSVKSLKNLQIIGLLVTQRNAAFCLISSMVLGLLNQQQILWQLSDRIARTFNRSGATGVVILDISQAFERVWHNGLLHKLKSFGISDQIFGLFSNRQFWVVLNRKSSKEYLVNAGVPQGFVLGFCYTLMTFLMTLSVVLLYMLIVLLSIPNVISHLICGSN